MKIPVGLIHYTETRVDRFSDTPPKPLSVKFGRFVRSGQFGEDVEVGQALSAPGRCGTGNRTAAKP